MGKIYYYFAATLPMLNFDGVPPVSTEEFLQQCENLLDVDDYSFVCAALSGDKEMTSTKNKAFYSWIEFDRNFRNEIALFRAERAHKDPFQYIRGDHYVDPYLAETVEEAAKNDDLLSAEKMLDRVRWEFLDALSSSHYFDIEYIMTYALKLKILERYQEVRSNRGQEVFETLKEVEVPLEAFK